MILGSLAGGRDDPPSLPGDPRLDHGDDERIAPEPVALGHQEDVAGADLPQPFEPSGPPLSSWPSRSPPTVNWQGEIVIDWRNAFNVPPEDLGELPRFVEGASVFITG